MANIVDTSAIKFSNEQMRPVADMLMKVYWLSKAAAADWTAKGFGTLIPNDSSPMSDGAGTDGRTPITGADLNVLLAHMATFVTDFEATSAIKRNQINKVAVNTH